MRLFKNRKQCIVLIRTPLKVQHLQGLLKRWDQSCVMARTRDPYCLRQPILPRRSVSLHNLGSSLCGIVNGPRATLLSSLLSKDAPSFTLTNLPKRRPSIPRDFSRLGSETGRTVTLTFECWIRKLRWIQIFCKSYLCIFACIKPQNQHELFSKN